MRLLYAALASFALASAVAADTSAGEGATLAGDGDALAALATPTPCPTHTIFEAEVDWKLIEPCQHITAVS